jgi:predicted RNase H-like nuclease (RuvC/YqgF family)
MAQIEGKGEYAIPKELMAIMPRDPHEQLDLAKMITSMAIESQVSQLEAEVVHFRGKVSEKDRAIAELKERLLELDQDFRKADGRLRSVLEENVSVKFTPSIIVLFIFLFSIITKLN